MDLEIQKKLCVIGSVILNSASKSPSINLVISKYTWNSVLFNPMNLLIYSVSQWNLIVLYNGFEKISKIKHKDKNSKENI